MPRRKAKQRGGQINLKKIGRRLKPFGRAIYNSWKPYLKETAQAGVAGLGAAASLAQPELAPFIIPATMGLSAFAGEVVDDPSILFGKKKRNKYIANQLSNQYQNNFGYTEQPYTTQPAVPANYIYQAPMTSVPTQWGYGLYAQSGQGLYAHSGKGLYAQPNGAYGEGLFAGGSLLSQNGNLHPALVSSNPDFLKNKHLSIYAYSY